LPRCDAADDLPKNKFLNLDPIASTTQGLAAPPAGESGGSTNACEDRSRQEKQTFGQFLTHIIDDGGMELIEFASVSTRYMFTTPVLILSPRRPVISLLAL
jgi:hypothetical protein